MDTKANTLNTSPLGTGLSLEKLRCEYLAIGNIQSDNNKQYETVAPTDILYLIASGFRNSNISINIEKNPDTANIAVIMTDKSIFFPFLRYRKKDNKEKYKKGTIIIELILFG